MELKLVLVGMGGVGKSALALCYVANTFSEDYDPTIEGMANQKILDTAGQEEYETMQDHWFRVGMGFLLIYSVVNRASFDKTRVLHEKITRIKENSPFSVVLVGNKCDLKDERQVRPEEGQLMAEEFGVTFFEASAKTHQNVDESFIALVREVRKKDPRWLKKVADKKAADSQNGKTKGGGKRGCTLL